MSVVFAASPQIRSRSSFILTRNTLVGGIGAYDFLSQEVELVRGVDHQISGTSVATPTAPSLSSPRKKLSLPIVWLLNIIIAVAILASGVFFGPKILYALFEPNTVSIEGQFSETALGGKLSDGTSGFAEGGTAKAPAYVPPFNENLPEGDWIEIPLIGVRSQLQDTENEYEALDTGIWHDPKYGYPGDDGEMPIVVAAHRYGWQWWWKDDYWQYHSFYRLPETEPGDIIEITSGQRKYIYEIYAATEGTAVTDLSADLILYTCKHLNSDIRYFRYARLIDPTKDSQEVL